MSEVKRYDPGCDYAGQDEMVESFDGAYVKWEDYEALKAQCDALAAESVALKEFFSVGISAAFEGCDWYGDDIQGKALELGLIREEKYDHKTHAESVFNPEDFQQDDVVFTINETPATDSYLNSVRADGAIDILCELLDEISVSGKGASRWRLGFVDYAWAIVAEKRANHLNKLRAGEPS